MTGEKVYDIMPELKAHDQSNHDKNKSCFLIMQECIYTE